MTQDYQTEALLQLVSFNNQPLALFAHFIERNCIISLCSVLLLPAIILGLVVLVFVANVIINALLIHGDLMTTSIIIIITRKRPHFRFRSQLRN